MLEMILLTAFIASPQADGRPARDVQLLLDTIDTLQQPVEDFRCEFEGSTRYKGKVAEAQKRQLGADGLSHIFSGTFVWKRGGDTYSDCLRQTEPDKTITRESLVVRMGKREAENYYRQNDAPLGYAVIESPDQTNSWRPDSLGWIFLIDKLKRLALDPGLDGSVSEDQFEGRPLKVLNIAMTGAPNSLFMRFWIDLGRNGHVVRYEAYATGNVLQGRLNIKLAPFQMGKVEVWMPIAGETAVFSAVEDNKPIFTKEPTVLDTIYVVDGTMQFNKKPGPEVFTLKYKPGTPISDRLKKFDTEFGQQKIGVKPTIAEAEAMLKEQIARADGQKDQLIVASTSDGTNWWPWTVGGLVAAVLGSLIALVVQRQSR